MSQFYPYIRVFQKTSTGTSSHVAPPVGAPFEWGTLPIPDENGDLIEAPLAQFCCFALQVDSQGQEFTGTMSVKTKRDGVELFQFGVSFDTHGANAAMDETKILTNSQCAMSLPMVPVKAGFQNPLIASGGVYGDPAFPNYGGTLFINRFVGSNEYCMASFPWLEFPFTSGLEFEWSVEGFAGVGPPFGSGLSGPLFKLHYITAFNPIPKFAADVSTGPDLNSIVPVGTAYSYAPGFTGNPSYDPALHPPIVARGVYYQDGPEWVEEPLPTVLPAGSSFELPLEDGPNELWIYTRDADGAIGWQKLTITGTSPDHIGAVTMPDGSFLMATRGAGGIVIRRLDDGQTVAGVARNVGVFWDRLRLIRHPTGRVFVYGRNRTTKDFERVEVPL